MKIYKSLLVLVVLCFWGCQKQYESIRLIPKGFQGAIAIIYKAKSGKICPEEKGAIVYEIPSNGILKVQREVFYGNQEHDFYYVDSLGNREPIPYIKDWNNVDKKSSKVVCFDETINSSELLIDGKKEPYKYSVFLIGQINKSDSLFKLKDSFLDKIR
jgi:hypothetical protein